VRNCCSTSATGTSASRPFHRALEDALRDLLPEFREAFLLRIASWAHGGLEYRLVSDTADADADQLVGLLRGPRIERG
jgi:hypothetical protein